MLFLFLDLEEGDYVTEEPSKCHSLCEDDDELNGGRDCCHAAALCRCGTQTGLYQCICPAGHYGTGIGDDCKRESYYDISLVKTKYELCYHLIYVSRIIVKTGAVMLPVYLFMFSMKFASTS